MPSFEKIMQDAASTADFWLICANESVEKHCSHLTPAGKAQVIAAYLHAAAADQQAMLNYNKHEELMSVGYHHRYEE